MFLYFWYSKVETTEHKDLQKQHQPFSQILGTLSSWLARIEGQTKLAPQIPQN